MAKPEGESEVISARALRKTAPGLGSGHHRQAMGYDSKRSHDRIGPAGGCDKAAAGHRARPGREKGAERTKQKTIALFINPRMVHATPMNDALQAVTEASGIWNSSGGLTAI
jgi:hypothetical protein